MYLASVPLLLISVLTLHLVSGYEKCVHLKGNAYENFNNEEKTNYFNCTVTSPCLEDLKTVTFIGILKSNQTTSEVLAFTTENNIVDKSGYQDVLGFAAQSVLNTNGLSYLAVSYKQDSDENSYSHIDCIVRGVDSNEKSVIFSDVLKYKSQYCNDKNINEYLHEYCGSVFTNNKSLYCISKMGISNISEAISYCTLMNGYLAEVDDRNEYLAIQSEFNKVNANDLMLGGTDSFKEGAWVYRHSKRSVSFFDWSQNQPDNSHGNEHCLEFKKMYDSKMNDEPCFNLNHNFICEIP